jgi:cobalt-zinc-cadmium efflux system outer membrane protein
MKCEERGRRAPGKRGRWPAAALALGVVLGGCVHEGARPLVEGPDLATDASQLSVDVSRIRLAQLPARALDPARGVDPTDAAVLAVLNSPDLAAKRAAAHVADAQAFSAGLLPDPQVALSADLPVSPVGFVSAYGITPSIDLQALITHAATARAAKAAAKQANLNLLWSEWSTAQQARQNAVTALLDELKAAVLAQIDAELAERARQSGLALGRHDVTATVAGADLAAKIDADTQLATARRDSARARGQLNALIGLAPQVRLPLVDAAAAAPPDPAALEGALASLPHRRPDLLALQAGYASQNANLRRAILAQFPMMSLGYSRQSDTSAVLTNGIAVTTTVPIFNRNRGDIHVQVASREQLAQEYRARLDQTVADVAQAGADLHASQSDLQRLEADVPRLEAEARRARPAFARGDMDSAAYLAIEQTALRELVALWDTRLSQRLAAIGVDTVLFLPPEAASRP